MAGDVTEFVHQDASLWADSCLFGFAAAGTLTIALVSIAARRLR